MKLAANIARAQHLIEAPSIRAALELLSEKEPEGQQGTLIDVEAERQARIAAEAKAEAERQARETSDNFMSVYKRFGDGKLPIISNLRPTILYTLAAPSTPDAVIDRAIEKAESGEKVTVADVKDWKTLEAELEAERQARIATGQR